MDMTSYTSTNQTDSKLLRLLEALRRNKDIIAHVFMHLSNYPPNASAAKECFDELSYEDQTAIWSVSTTAGGVWETWERHAIKFGNLDTPSYRHFRHESLLEAS